MGHAATLRAISEEMRDNVERGLGMRTPTDERFEGCRLQLDGRAFRNFGSCSYLGLELDARLKAGAIDAIERYGTQFSSSRLYISAPPYTELEARLGEIFDASVVVTPTTTLGHQAALPVLVHEDDAIVLDQAAHASVKTAASQLRLVGAHVEVVRHNRLDLLEERIEALRHVHPRVWYMADGVYSMYGDLAPLDAIFALLDRYEQLHFYVDDAHGMSWSGERGRGCVLGTRALHPRMVLATSLNKSFGAGGGALVLPDPDQAMALRTSGPPLLFSGPLQPGTLGAAIASAKIHLGPEIRARQQQLEQRMELASALLRDAGLPVASHDRTPVRFVPCGLPDTARALATRMIGAGFWVNAAHFPAVAARRAGVRFTVTTLQEPADIEALVEAFDEHFEAAFEASGACPESVWRDFHLGAPQRRPRRARAHGQPPASGAEPSAQPLAKAGPAPSSSGLALLSDDSIDARSAADWDAVLGERGSFGREGLRFLERNFRRQDDAPNDWRFRYYRVLGDDGKLLAASFFTLAPWKADMLASSQASRAAEQRRAADPDFLVVRAFAMGSLLTEGDHLYLDRGDARWRDALGMLLEAARADARSAGAEMLVVRDLAADDLELDAAVRGAGFVRQSAPPRHSIEVDPGGEEAWLASWPRKRRKHHYREVRPWNDHYRVEVIEKGARPLEAAEHVRLRELYAQVKEQSLEVNTFALPDDLFECMERDANWELMLLYPSDTLPGDEAATVAVVGAFRGRSQYCPMVVGLDYAYVRGAGLYRQVLRHLLLRTVEVGARRLHLGVGASLEKRRFGAHAEAQNVYLQADDHYVFEAVQQLGAS